MDSKRIALIGVLLCGGSLPFLTGAGGGGCGSFTSTTPAPDVAGNWAISYGNTMSVKVTIGGVSYSQELTPSGGSFTIMHQGKPYAFGVDCSRPEVVCPSEVWPTTVMMDQRDTMYKHRMWVKIPVQQCSGVQVPPQSNQCGTGTPNPECKPVCTGAVSTSTADAFGLISESGDRFDLFLGGGFATNGVNCALLGLSAASAQIVSTGQNIDWQATELRAGTVKTGYAGGCLWAGAVDPMTGKPEALVLGATVEISTPFTGKRL
ncbi:MAG TPA: hypothetical protein PKL17_06875 [Pseudomonadota bacterium]|jgi:hypothetical protein|nr:hypothetical protein [Pseudomonadota bacterium]HND10186.1 hypothetical protein [Pseudomonadota bacterium]HNK44486.1 hypothetical protein [Pseudomonadota bacterium]HNN52413.1 hypothetical protein [Pseudomonadota bacterium]